jgi:hypothetical protein
VADWLIGWLLLLIFQCSILDEFDLFCAAMFNGCISVLVDLFFFPLISFIFPHDLARIAASCFVFFGFGVLSSLSFSTLLASPSSRRTPFPDAYFSTHKPTHPPFRFACISRDRSSERCYLLGRWLACHLSDRHV